MSGIKIDEYSLKSNGEAALSANFRVREFASKDGDDKVFIAPALVTLLQKIRDKFGSVTITSAYRTKSHNAKIGGSSSSQHLLGTSADIQIKGVSLMQIAQYAELLLGNAGGVGLYSTFVHVDVRANRSRWDQRSGVQVTVKGFPGYVDPDAAKKASPQAVQEIQNMPEVAAADAVPVVVGNTKISGIRINGSIYAPVRAIGEAAGLTVHWDGKQVTVK